MTATPGRCPTVAVLLAGITFVHAGVNANAANWPQFRGPARNGQISDSDLPLAWDAKSGKNVRWSVPVDGAGVASPIVWNDRVFVMNVAPAPGADDPEAAVPQHRLTCFRADDGERLWRTVVEPGPWNRGGFKGGRGGGYANCTPCTDGERIFCLFGSSVVVACDFDGRAIWRHELRPFRYNYEMASSPVLVDGKLLVFCGTDDGARLRAFDPRSGDVLYDRPLPDTGYCHSSPMTASGDAGRTLLIAAASSRKEAANALQAFDVRNGDRVWWCAGIGATASPVVSRNLVYFDGGRGGPGSLVDVTGTGDVTATHVKWTQNVGESLGSPLVVGDHLYRLGGGGVLTCRDLSTGERVYQSRTAASAHWACPIADPQGRIYLASAGRTAVVQAGPEFRVLATNDLGDSNHASPAVSNGRIYLLGTEKLWCIGAR